MQLFLDELTPKTEQKKCESKTFAQYLIKTLRIAGYLHQIE